MIDLNYFNSREIHRTLKEEIKSTKELRFSFRTEAKKIRTGLWIPVRIYTMYILGIDSTSLSLLHNFPISPLESPITVLSPLTLLLPSPVFSSPLLQYLFYVAWAQTEVSFRTWFGIHIPLKPRIHFHEFPVHAIEIAVSISCSLLKRSIHNSRCNPIKLWQLSTFTFTNLVVFVQNLSGINA